MNKAVCLTEMRMKCIILRGFMYLFIYLFILLFFFFCRHLQYILMKFCFQIDTGLRKNVFIFQEDPDYALNKHSYQNYKQRVWNEEENRVMNA